MTEARALKEALLKASSGEPTPKPAAERRSEIEAESASRYRAFIASANTTSDPEPVRALQRA